MLKNQDIRNVLKALFVAIFGFVLINVALITYFGFQSLIDLIVGLFTSANINVNLTWYPELKYILFAIVIFIISWLILRAKIRPVFKAAFLMVPSTLIFVTAGIFLYRWPAIAYSLSVILGLAVLYYFYRTKKNWMYWFSFILLALSLAAFSLTGGQI